MTCRLPVALGALGIVFAWCASYADNAKTADARIARVETGLMPITATKDKRACRRIFASE
jgi:hypothetical protein